MKHWREAAVDLLFWCGAGLVSAGVGLLAGLAAALISAGGFALVASALTDAGGDGKDGEAG